MSESAEKRPVGRPLANTRHERFAQELAKGKSQVEAYELAGYNPSRSAAARLAADVNICARVSEIAERVAVRTEMTVAGLTDRLMRIADVAERTGVKVDEETGEASESSSKHLSVARAALMDAAKLNGLVIDRAERGKPGDFERMTDDELADFVRAEAAALGLGGAGTEAANGQAGVRGKPSGLH